MPEVLNLPFDESDGSIVAYDYSSSGLRADVHSARFIPGRNGNCIYFPGSGYAEIIGEVFPLDVTYTVMFWVMAELTANGPFNTWVLFKFAGRNQYLRLELNTKLENWTHIAITHQNGTFRTYVNSRPIDTEQQPGEWGTPTGFCILNDNGFNDAGHCYQDSFRVITQVAYTQEDLLNLIDKDTMIPKFFINGLDFQSYGVTVQKLDGVIDSLAMKDPMKVDWDGYHGEVIDLLKPMLDVRTIEMDCWIKGFGRDDFTAQIHSFREQLERPLTQRLMIMLGSKPLIYEVYLKEGFQVKNNWVDGVMVGTFNLKLREPEPVKRILKQIVNSIGDSSVASNNSVTITLTSKKLLSIYWGDGTRTRNVYGTNKTITHTYTANGEFFIVVSGVIEEITAFTTNAVIVWNRL